MRSVKIVAVAFLALYLQLILASCAYNGELQTSNSTAQDDLPYYKTYVSFDTASGQLQASVDLTLTVTGDPANGVLLLLAQGMNLQLLSGQNISGYTQSPFAAVPSWQNIHITLSEQVKAGDKLTVQLKYQGTPAYDEHRMNRISPEWIELTVDSAWHPLLADFATEMRGELYLQLAPHWQLVASGDVTYQNGYHKVDYKIPQADVAFSAAPALDKTEADNFAVFSAANPRLDIPDILQSGSRCLNWLNSEFGSVKSLHSAKLVIAPRTRSSYARKNYIVLADDKNIASVADTANIELLCHEFAHYWTGFVNPFSADYWMTEAFAEFSAYRFLTSYELHDAAENMLRYWQKEAKNAGAIWTPDSRQRPEYKQMYRKAPYLLYLLQQRLTPQQFNSFYRRYMSGGINTTAALLDMLGQVTNETTRLWFSQQLAATSELSATY